MMSGVARIGDPISCGDVEAGGSGNVFANGMPVTRVGPDMTAGHCWSPTPIASGSATVFVNNLPVARKDDPIVVHGGCPNTSPHGGTISGASPNVFADS
jgi:uncharacterized Zn-binding protein involved in type VI secretion